MKNLRKIFLLFLFCSLSVALMAGGQEQQPKNLVITGARLIDGTGAPPLENAVIVITNGKFKAVGTKGKVTLPKEAEVIDVKGKTVIPGLIDTHVHFTYPQKNEEWFLLNDSIASFRSAHFLHRLLMVGITTVRDVAGYHNVSIIAKKAFREGRFIGSRPIVVGQGITCTGGHGSEGNVSGLVVEVDGPTGFRRGVREQLKAGADLIKILPPYSREEIEAAVEETHYYGRLVTVHSGHSGLMLNEYYDFVRWAVEAGADCIEHGFAIPDDVIKTMAEKGTYCVPNIEVMLRIAARVKKDTPEREEMVERFLNSSNIFRKMKKLGVKMGVGTDAVGYMAEYPWIYFEEIERFVEHGYTPMEVIVAATKINAEVCGASDWLGTVEDGKVADLVVIDGDPLKDIKALRNARIIIQEGKIIKR